MFIHQISVFLENRPGTLRELTAHLGKCNIDIRELSIADTQAFGIVRILVKAADKDRTMDMLKEAGYTARVNHVICAEIGDTPGCLCRLLTIIEEAGISVEYMYSCRRTPEGHALLVLRLSRQEEGCAVLEAHGVHVLTQEEIDAL